jgi:hypothetical protein
LNQEGREMTMDLQSTLATITRLPHLKEKRRHAAIWITGGVKLVPRIDGLDKIGGGLYGFPPSGALL